METLKGECLGKKGGIGRTQRVYREVKVYCMIIIEIHVIITHL